MAGRLVQAVRHVRPPVVGKLRKRLAWLALAIFGPIILGLGWVLWAGSSQIIAPGPLPLGDYQQQALAEPALTIERHVTTGGDVPYLAVAPNGTIPGERGKTLREQLTTNGFQLSIHGETHGTIVLLHGRRGRKESLLRVAERFTAIGFRCLIPDLPAHGESPMAHVAYGASTLEKTLPSTLITHARQTLGWPNADEPIGLWGMSMGGALATAAAASSPDEWKALMILCSFDDLNSVLSDKLDQLAGPLAPALQHALQSLVHRRSGLAIEEVKPNHWAALLPPQLPVFVAHGDADSLIHHARGQTLFDAFPGRDKKWLTVTDAGHHNILITDQPVYASMGSWLLQRMRQ